MNNNKLMALILALASASVANAGEPEDALVKQVLAAYGGDKLTSLTSFQVDERYLSPTAGQGRSPLRQEIGRNNQLLSVDLVNNKFAYETWNAGRGGSFLGATISDGEVAYSLNYQARTYGEATSSELYSIAGGSIRTSDALLARELARTEGEVAIQAEVDYMNRPHTTLLMPFPQSPDLILYIDQETHLISKMSRNNPAFGDLDYIYTDYQQHQGITYAASINFFIGGAANLISTRHQLQFNVPFSAQTFELPEGFSPESERINTDEMLVNKLSDRVFHIGQGSGYGIFVDTGTGIVAAGGYPALQARFERFQQESGVHRPLAHQVVTHHHSDHLGGLGEAVSLGAKLVTVSDNIEPIKASVSPAPADWQFQTVGKQTTFGEGRHRVEVYEVATLHAASFLVTYVPAEKLVFIADHMGSPYKTGLPVAGMGTVSMYEALSALDIDIDKIATAHNARIFSWSDMKKSVAAYEEVTCAGDRPICS